MHTMKRPAIKQKAIRFDTSAQVQKIAKAAQAKRWSFNRFVVEASLGLAEQTLMASKNGNEQLIVDPNQLTLNQ